MPRAPVSEAEREQILREIRQDLEALNAFVAEHGSFAQMMGEYIRSLPDYDPERHWWAGIGE